MLSLDSVANYTSAIQHEPEKLHWWEWEETIRIVSRQKKQTGSLMLFLIPVLCFWCLWQGEQHHNSHFYCFLLSLKCWSHITILIYVSQTCDRIFRSILFSNCIIYSYLCLSFCWVGHAWLPDTHTAVLSFPILTRTGGENRTEKLVSQEKDRKIHYCHMQNRLPLCKINLI